MNCDGPGNNGIQNLRSMRKGCDDKSVFEWFFGGFEEGVHRRTRHSLDIFYEDKFCRTES